MNKYCSIPGACQAGVLNRKAFTLIELSGAQETARTAKSNLRQVGIALQMYVQEHSAYPSFVYSAGVDTYDWQDALDSLIGDTFSRDTFDPFDPIEGQWGNRGAGSVFSCPSYERLSKVRYPFGYNAAGVGAEGRLGLGGHADPRSLGGPPRLYPMKENEIVNPAQMIAVGDAVLETKSTYFNPKLVRGHQDLSVGIRTGRHTYAPLPGSTYNPQRRHRGMWNLMFCDGHVEGLKGPQAFDSKRDEVRRLWNADNESHPEFQPLFP